MNGTHYKKKNIFICYKKRFQLNSFVLQLAIITCLAYLLSSAASPILRAQDITQSTGEQLAQLDIEEEKAHQLNKRRYRQVAERAQLKEIPEEEPQEVVQEEVIQEEEEEEEEEEKEEEEEEVVKEAAPEKKVIPQETIDRFQQQIDRIREQARQEVYQAREQARQDIEQARRQAAQQNIQTATPTPSRQAPDNTLGNFRTFKYTNLDDANKAYNNKEYKKAFEIYREYAAQGYPKAQYYLGVLFYYGRGVSQDYDIAHFWFRKAADQGDPFAEYAVGVGYYYGHGVNQDYKQVYPWFKRAAEKGVPAAQNNIGYYYENGNLLPQDYTQAYIWYRRAAVQGNANAMVNLGNLYQEGLGVLRDYVRAHMWLNLSASTGQEEAANKRNALELRMTENEIAAAEQLAKNCKEDFPKDC